MPLGAPLSTFYRSILLHPSLEMSVALCNVPSWACIGRSIRTFLQKFGRVWLRLVVVVSLVLHRPFSVMDRLSHYLSHETRILLCPAKSISWTTLTSIQTLWTSPVPMRTYRNYQIRSVTTQEDRHNVVAPIHVEFLAASSWLAQSRQPRKA